MSAMCGAPVTNGAEDGVGWRGRRGRVGRAELSACFALLCAALLSSLIRSSAFRFAFGRARDTLSVSASQRLSVSLIT